MHTKPHCIPDLVIAYQAANYFLSLPDHEFLFNSGSAYPELEELREAIGTRPAILNTIDDCSRNELLYSEESRYQHETLESFLIVHFRISVNVALSGYCAENVLLLMLHRSSGLIQTELFGQNAFRLTDNRRPVECDIQ